MRLAKKLMTLAIVITMVCLFTLSVAPPSAHASSSRVGQMHTDRAGVGPNTSGGGCGKVYTIVYLYACVSQSGSTVVPDAYIAPRPLRPFQLQ